MRPRSLPPLWAISARRPNAVIEQLPLIPLADWPRGFYGLRQAIPFRVVVVRELPASRETLLLRLMGREEVLAQAIHEVRALPRDAWEARAAAAALDVLRSAGASTGDPIEEAIIMSARETYERIKNEGRVEGRKEGLLRAVLRQLELRFGALDAATVERVERASLETLERIVERLLTAPTLREALDDA